MHLRTLTMGAALGLMPQPVIAQAPIELDGYVEWSRGNHIIVDGQRVFWDGRTRVTLKVGGSPSSIPLGSEVKVKGWRQPEGTVLASRLETKPNGSAMWEAEARQGGVQVEGLMVQQAALFTPGPSGEMAFVGRLHRSGPMVDRLRSILTRVAPSYVDASSIRLYVVETTDWNAFVTANGAVVVYAGLAEAMNDDEMAIVLGHELAHYTHEHMRRKMKRAMWVQMAGAVTEAAIAEVSSQGAQYGLALSAMLTLSAIQNGYGRDLEDQADRVGLRYAHEGGFDVTTGPTLWRKFGDRSRDTDRVTNFFMGDHSLSAARVKNLELEIRNNYATAPPARHAGTLPVPATVTAPNGKVVEGLSEDQVRTLLGQPALVDRTKGTSWLYPAAQGVFRVYFVNGRATTQAPSDQRD